jgi:CrcB protein
MATLSTMLFIFFGASLGALSRFATQEIFAARTRLPGWVAIYAVNMLGCLILGFGQVYLADETVPGTAVTRLISAQNNDRDMFSLLVGFCGGLTTFSTFSLDNVFLSHGKPGQLLFNIFGSVSVGILMAMFGMYLAHQLVPA